MREKSQRWLQGLWPEQLTRMEFPFIEMRKAVGNSKLQDWKVVIQLWTCYELDVSYICGSVEWAVAYMSLELRGKVLTGGYKCGRHKNLDIIWKPWACPACIHPLPIYSAGSQATQPIAQVTCLLCKLPHRAEVGFKAWLAHSSEAQPISTPIDSFVRVTPILWAPVPSPKKWG